MRTPLLYAGMLAARELSSILNAEELWVTLCELHDGNPEFICSKDPEALLNHFEGNISNAECSSFVHHGIVTFTDGSKCDAIIVRTATASSEWIPFVVGIPYRATSHPKGFAIYGPVVLNADSAEESADDWLDFLFEGFETENPKLWSEYSDTLDE
ncbi:hypothetical protein SH528x_003027 [Novipirellula sp. SH528]|uniref:hypothetical protein n=1 Tax=Novipirellula sp. SH528 TaxID=3454466 RepID=UPI003FA02EFF